MLYEFTCLKCGNFYEELTSYDSTGQYEGVECPACGSMRKVKEMSCCAYKFTNPVGTDKWISDSSGHDYRFKYNLPNVQHQRKEAEKLSHVGANPYREIPTSDNFGPVQ